MPRYRVDCTYDMGMSSGRETHVFDAADDAAAQRYIKENEGGWLSPIKRQVHFNERTLARVVGSE